MTTTDASEFGPSRALERAGGPREVPQVFFDRAELQRILNVYGRMVIAGEWRDYAIDASRDGVAFSVFRRTSETPLYRIEKRPKLARKQGAFAVVSGSGLVLRRGHELEAVLRYFDKKLFKLVD